MQIRAAEPADLEALAVLWRDGWHDAHAALVPAELVRRRTPDNFHTRMTAMLPTVRTLGPVAAAGRVEVEPPALPGCPGVENRVEDLPCPLDLVVASEERGVADHAVEQERLVGVGRVDGERRPVAEVHVDAPDLEPRPRDLRTEAQQDPLVGLDADGEDVRLHRRRRPRARTGPAAPA